VAKHSPDDRECGTSEGAGAPARNRPSFTYRRMHRSSGEAVPIQCLFFRSITRHGALSDALLVSWVQLPSTYAYQSEHAGKHRIQRAQRVISLTMHGSRRGSLAACSLAVGGHHWLVRGRSREETSIAAIWPWLSPLRPRHPAAPSSFSCPGNARQDVMLGRTASNGSSRRPHCRHVGCTVADWTG